MQSFLRYSARTAKGLEPYAIKELRSLGIKAKINPKFGNPFKICNLKDSALSY